MLVGGHVGDLAGLEERTPHVPDRPDRGADPDHQPIAAGAEPRRQALQHAIGVGVREPIERVALYVDGKPVSRDGAAPYTVHWDTTAESEGSHSLLVYARTKHGRRAAVEVPIVVANAPTFPPSLASNWSAHELTSDL